MIKSGENTWEEKITSLYRSYKSAPDQQASEKWDEEAKTWVDYPRLHYIAQAATGIGGDSTWTILMKDRALQAILTLGGTSDMLMPKARR